MKSCFQLAKMCITCRRKLKILVVINLKRLVKAEKVYKSAAIQKSVSAHLLIKNKKFLVHQNLNMLLVYNIKTPDHQLILMIRFMEITIL